VKVDPGCGNAKREGFVAVDVSADCDIHCNFEFRLALQYTDARAKKSADEKVFARQHFVNIVTDPHGCPTRR